MNITESIQFALEAMSDKMRNNIKLGGAAIGGAGVGVLGDRMYLVKKLRDDQSASVSIAAKKALQDSHDRHMKMLDGAMDKIKSLHEYKEMNITESIKLVLEGWGSKTGVGAGIAGAGAVGTIGGYQHGQNTWARGMMKHIDNSKGSAPEGSIAASLYGKSNVPKPPVPPGIKIMRSASELGVDTKHAAQGIIKRGIGLANKFTS